VAARSSSSLLKRHFRKLDRDTRLKAVQVVIRISTRKFRYIFEGSLGAYERNTQVV
jgi:hypothetical protein